MIESASICLYCSSTARVLLGRRLCNPWKGYWACPGGKLEPSEGHLAAAIRELHEETSVQLSAVDPVWRMELTTAWNDREFHIVNFGFQVSSEITAKSSTELEVSWVPFGAVLKVSPMAEGTRAVMERLVRQSGLNI